MERFGVVEEEKQNRAVVKIRRHIACEGCNRCGDILNRADNRESLVEVLNPIKAEKGQTVRIETSSHNMLLASFIIYMVPLFIFLGGLFLGRGVYTSLGYAGNPDIAGLLIGLAAMLIGFAALRWWDKKISVRDKFKAVITGVVDDCSADSLG